MMCTLLTKTETKDIECSTVYCQLPHVSASHKPSTPLTVLVMTSSFHPNLTGTIENDPMMLLEPRCISENVFGHVIVVARNILLAARLMLQLQGAQSRQFLSSSPPIIHITSQPNHGQETESNIPRILDIG